METSEIANIPPEPPPQQEEDLNKIVQIQLEHGEDVGVLTPAPVQAPLDPVQEERSGGQAGEGIEEGVWGRVCLPGPMEEGSHDPVFGDCETAGQGRRLDGFFQVVVHT